MTKVELKLIRIRTKTKVEFYENISPLKITNTSQNQGR
jgi:hypothetical protein